MYHDVILFPADSWFQAGWDLRLKKAKIMWRKRGEFLNENYDRRLEVKQKKEKTAEIQKCS